MTPASALDGVVWGEIAQHSDERGSFRELWRASAFDHFSPASGGSTEQRLTFTQSNLSISGLGVLRGLHLHQRQLDHWVVAKGTAFIALVDVRPMLQGEPSPKVETRVAPMDTTVSIPVGVAHGFLAVEPIELIYFTSNDYDGSDELGFAWDDPVADVNWPAISGGPILSPRDRSNPPLIELVRRLRATGSAS
jgi:dTDP-4-dehydrorhamnose 3,5-epimerase